MKSTGITAPELKTPKPTVPAEAPAIDPDFDRWYEQAEPLVVQGRGVLLPSVVFAVLFITGLMGWTVLMSPKAPQATIEAMLGLTQSRDGQRDPAQHAPRGWAASISEEANFSGDAKVLPPPAPGDWLYDFPEQGQTFAQFVAQSRGRRSEGRDKIYVLPLGPLEPEARSIVKVTAEFLDAYYDTPAVVLPPARLPTSAFDGSRSQYDAIELLKRLKESLPADALGLLAVTDSDIFIPSVNFVFGLGSYRQRVGVLSLQRYGHDMRLVGEAGTVLRRSLTVAVHEFGHVLSMRHCTAFRCVMNGTNSLREADSHPLHLCPVCRRKAEFAIGYHRQDRYARLLDFYDRLHFTSEAEFVRRRLDPPEVEFLDDKGQPLNLSRRRGQGSRR